ncbi:MAG: ankyrin repeat domain-containing protein [Candidatus Neptunochlamydia sp.]|nr:ankyrin repeat domain-containing protein [Candidatus Neptunochlamydia sp.]
MQDWNFRDSLGISVVHYASQCKNGVFLKELLQRGDMLEVFDSQGFSPLHYAAAQGSTNCIKILLSRCPNLLEKKGKDGQTPLFSAVQHEAFSAVELLLESRVNPNSTIIDLTPLLWAIQSKNTPIATKLIEHPDVDLDYAVKGGKTALEFAIQMEESQILKKLIVNGADVNRLCKGHTPHANIAVVSQFLINQPFNS